MEIPIRGGLSSFDLGRVVAAFFSRTGIARLARRWRPSDACVLTFHGVIDDSDRKDLLDVDQHVPVTLFAQVCDHLASHYTVLPLSEIMGAMRNGKSLPRRTVAITFDDGYASNHDLAFPVLQARSLPATFFITSGYLDRRVNLWFHRIEMAFFRTPCSRLVVELEGSLVTFPLHTAAERGTALGVVTKHLKQLPCTEMLDVLARVEAALGVEPGSPDELPRALRPMSWDQARAMQASGLMEFGGHTDTHPILARCSEQQQAEEVRQSQVRLREELGRAPSLFAYPNGKAGDFTAVTQRLLGEAGFTSSFTMLENFLMPGGNPQALPRYGCPSSRDYLEAVVSGSMARLHSFRKNLGLVRAA